MTWGAGEGSAPLSMDTDPTNGVWSSGDLLGVVGPSIRFAQKVKTHFDGHRYSSALNALMAFATSLGIE